MSTKPILVTGGTGKTGRRVAQRLEAQRIPVRIGSRAGTPPFDWEDRDSWAPVLSGVGAVYVAYHPDLAAPGASAAVAEFASLAVSRGVRRVVLLSGRGEPEAERAEHAVRTCGADWTILRSAWFAQNFSESFFLDGVIAGEVALPVGSVAEPFIDAEDIADVAAAALTDERHAHQLYELTGPRLLTFAEAVSEIARATGRGVRYEQVPLETYAAALADLGVPDEAVAFIRYLFGEVLDGRNAHLADGVRRALGREPRDFCEYARRAASSGVWDAAAGSVV